MHEILHFVQNDNGVSFIIATQSLGKEGEIFGRDGRGNYAANF